MEAAAAPRAHTPLGRASTGSLSSYGSGEAPPRTSFLKQGSGMRGAAAGAAQRPMTATKGAGYAAGMRPGTVASPTIAGTAARGSSGAGVGDLSEQWAVLEECVHALLEDSAAAAARGDAPAAVDAARDAARREQKLCALLEGAGQGDQICLELKFAVSLALAAAYQGNGQLGDALGVYTQVIRSRLFPQAGWLRLNMGNIHFQQQQYSQAVKLYRMALDQLPPALRRLRLNAMRNIGVALARLGRWQEAAESFSAVMQEGADHQTGFNLLLCAAALSDAELTRQAFVQLAQVPPYVEDGGDQGAGSRRSSSSSSEADQGTAAEGCELQLALHTKQAEADNYLLTAARLAAPLVSDSGWATGYSWCREQLLAAGHAQLASEVVLACANEHMARKEYAAALSLLREFKRGSGTQRARAAINLCTLHLLEGEVERAAAYAQYCADAGSSSPAALVAAGNVRLAEGQVEAALQLYEDALALDTACPQALFNAGLACKQLELPQRALALFQRLLQLCPGHVEAMWQAADLHEVLGDLPTAVQWLTRLLTLAPHDSGVLSRLGMLHAKLGDEAEAVQYQLDAFGIDRANVDAISWLGAHHVRRQDYLAAVPFFQAAIQAQPHEVKWPLMVAGCLRRVGRSEEALAQYRGVYLASPTNAEALRYLAQLSDQLGLVEDAQRYSAELQRLDRLKTGPGAGLAAGGPLPPLERVTAPRPPTSTGQRPPPPHAVAPAPPAAAAQQRRMSGMLGVGSWQPAATC